jgi:hypothetical protein
LFVEQSIKDGRGCGMGWVRFLFWKTTDRRAKKGTGSWQPIIVSKLQNLHATLDSPPKLPLSLAIRVDLSSRYQAYPPFTVKYSQSGLSAQNSVITLISTLLILPPLIKLFLSGFDAQVPFFYFFNLSHHRIFNLTTSSFGPFENIGLSIPSIVNLWIIL